eukprot:3340678-Rhodomonas_salina.1
MHPVHGSSADTTGDGVIVREQHEASNARTAQETGPMQTDSHKTRPCAAAAGQEIIETRAS